MYGININYYARISFNAVENIVDTLGGITINSEVDYNFTCKANNNCIIKPGLNNLDGKCALAFARESKAYETGELHKRKNQEQVIERIAEKLENSTDVVAQLEEILESMSGTFQTNITEEEISALSKMQIDEMAQWSVSVYNVTGKESYEYTYSYPTRKLRVIIPEEKTIEMAKSKLKEVLKK